MGAGVGMYPNGWDSPEVQQACGYTSKSYNMGEYTCMHIDIAEKRPREK